MGIHPKILNMDIEIIGIKYHLCVGSAEEPIIYVLLTISKEKTL